MTKTLEATEIRKEVRRACEAHGDDCKGCPFRYSCEEHFPVVDHTEARSDLLPVDYVLSDDGTVFVGEVE